MLLWALDAIADESAPCDGVAGAIETLGLVVVARLEEDFPEAPGLAWDADTAAGFAGNGEEPLGTDSGVTLAA